MRKDRVRIGLLFQIFRTSQIAGRLVGLALAPTGIRGDDYAVYSYLLHGPLTLTDLADGTGLPLTTAAGYLKRFEERGHLVRSSNPDDGRSQLISLTPEARQWVLGAARIFTKTVNSLDAVMENEGVDADDLVAQLDLVQNLIATSIEKLEED